MQKVDPNVIRIKGARVHNLRGVDLKLPKGKLICFTGVSGSGKSSLAFDTLYAEGQRRYIESLSSYARQFMGELPKPDVDHIAGLSPSISIQQKTSGWNPRSTVGTITQIHDYLRVLYARVGEQHCPECGKPITSQTREHMLARLLKLPVGARMTVLAPKIRGQKGEYRDLFAELQRQGFARARVDGEIIELSDAPSLDRYRRHDIEAVVDRLVNKPGVRPRLAEALETALEHGAGAAVVMTTAADSDENTQDVWLSAGNSCPDCNLSFEPLSPRNFSFNSPQGMCDYCDGLGERFDFDPDLLIPDPTLPFLTPCVAAMRKTPGRWRRHIYEGVAKHLKIDLSERWSDLPERARKTLLYGAGDAHITYEWKTRNGVWMHGGVYEGVIHELHSRYKKTNSSMVRGFYEQYMRRGACPRCGGARLNPRAQAVMLAGSTGDAAEERSTAYNISEVCRLPISRALNFFEKLVLDQTSARIAEEPLKEIRARLRFLIDVGLEYLTLDRSAPTLAGGESQRIRLASQIGSGLVGVLYVLDEPSIGLHHRDNRRLLNSLCRLRDMGNTVVVVEHDRDTMEAADVIVDFGPGPGVRGGKVVAHGDLTEVAHSSQSVTGAYLSGRESIEIPASRRPINRPKPKSRPSRKNST